nr:molybdenum formylmethanofuran dehydrogenase subunit [uncultured archaeon GZfos27A8]
MMKACNFGAIYAGLGVGSSYGKHRNVEAALNLIKGLNNHTKFSIGALRGHCNVAGFNQIASYLYGYPFGLDFAKGYPRFGSGRVHDGRRATRPRCGCRVCDVCGPCLPHPCGPCNISL